MIACPHCGFRNMSGESRCLKCQTLLVDDPAEVRQAIDRAPKYTLWNALGDRLRGLRARLVAATGWHRVVALPGHYVPYRLPIVAGAFTFLFPGAGQAYNHQRLKAVVFGGAWLLFAAFAIYTIRHPASNAILLALLLSWCALWTDAYVSAARVNGQNVHPRTALAILCGILATLAFSVTILQFAGANFLVIKTIRTGVMAPELQSGDMVLVNHTAYWFRSPRRGEVIQFNPERFTIEKPGGLITPTLSVNLTDYFQRVVAVEGDRVERRDGVCYVNGAPLPAALDAIGAQYIGDHAEFTVPAGRVYAPITGIPGDLFQALAEVLRAPTVHRIGMAGYIYRGLEEANLPGRDQWLCRTVALINPPVRRRWF